MAWTALRVEGGTNSQTGRPSAPPPAAAPRAGGIGQHDAARS